MKKFIFTLGLIAALSLSMTSCSTDDSGLDQTTSADGNLGTGTGTGDGNVNLPRPPAPKP